MIQYRADIDGLRAVAVGVIVLFHLGLGAMSGGFVGVDVFFVISGFLITSIIQRERAAGRFRFGRFYMRRLRRLGPALVAVLALTLIAGFLVVPPEHYQAQGAATVAALLSVSNIHFWTQAGYFDAEAVYKPLLHTWSLGVEEQFYLVWPATLLALTPATGGRGRALALFAALGLASLAAAEALLDAHPAAVFFLMPFRVCEFALGAALAVGAPRLQSPSLASGASLLGLAAILAAVFLFDEETRFPGVSALVPAAGAALVIAAGPSAAGNRLLSLAPVVYIGRISYSLYLVHWPIATLFNFRWGRAESWSEIGLLVAVAVGLAAVLYHWVETPFRRRGPLGFMIGGRQLGAGIAAAALVVVSAASHVASNDGYLWRLPKEIRALHKSITVEKRARRKAIRQKSCHYKQTDRTRYFDAIERCQQPAGPGMVVVFGDSHAADIWAALSRLYRDRSVVQLTGAGCGLSKREQYAVPCGPFYDHAAQWLRANRENIALVVYSQVASGLLKTDPTTGVPLAREAPLEDQLMGGLAALAAEGLPIFIWGPRPEFHPRITDSLALSTSLAGFRQRMSRTDMSLYRALDQSLAARSAKAGIPYASSFDVLCPDGVCRFLTDKGDPLIVDYGHWSPRGGRFVLRRMLEAHPALAAALEPPR